MIELQRIEFVGNGTRVLEERELDRLQERLAHNETWHIDYTIEPTMEGDRLRLLFLLFVDEPPPQPSLESAYRETHLWINVTASENDL